MPAISVIVPVFNIEPYLHRCVDSILKQVFTDFELILVDDGSTDRSGAICDEYAAQDSRVHVIHKENGGVSTARNAGIDWAVANSDSQWLAFVDSDDWLHPNYLAYLYRAAMENGVKVSACGYRNATDQSEIIEMEDYSTTVLLWEELFLKGGLLSEVSWSKLYAKNVLHGLRYPVGKCHEDEFLTYKLISQSPSISLVNCDLYYYFYNCDGLTKTSSPLKPWELVEAFEERLEYFQEQRNRKVLPKCIDRYLWSIFKAGRGLQVTEGIPEKDRAYWGKQMQKKMRHILFRYFPMTLKRSYVRYYVLAYPNLLEPLRRVYHAFKKSMLDVRKNGVSYDKSVENSKIVLQMIVHNECGRYLERALQSMADFVDYYVIVDDASTDDTPQLLEDLLRDYPHTIVRNKESLFHVEYKLRQQLWDEVSKHDPGWVLALDADEVLQDGAGVIIRRLIQNKSVDCYRFKNYDMWNEDEYREDPYWCSHKMYYLYLFRFSKSQKYHWRKMNQHCGRFPIEAWQVPYANINLKIQHFGWARKEDREAKYKRYMTLDGEGKWGVMEQYQSILDEHPTLKRYDELSSEL